MAKNGLNALIFKKSPINNRNGEVKWQVNTTEKENPTMAIVFRS